jgi:hypothetical protein
MTILHSVGVVLLVAPLVAFADGPLQQEPGVALAVGGAVGVNNDDMATDFEGTHAIVALQIGYRARFGTEGFATAGIGMGGHEAVFQTWGIGVRQRLRFDRVEPFLQLGIHEVGDETNVPLALGLGLGADVRLTRGWFAGASVDRFFSRDSDELGGLDWAVRLQFGIRFGSQR